MHVSVILSKQAVSQLKNLYFFSCLPGLDPGSRFRNTLKFYWIPCQARDDENPTYRIFLIVTQSVDPGSRLRKTMIFLLDPVSSTGRQ